MASSSSTHVHPTIKPDVFISFRGEDVRRGFLSHLETKLRSRKEIDFYIDNMLQSGEEISPTLLETIEGSMISLVIFSKDYASSKWCLEELVKIMECKELNGQIVVPVFYYVDPTHVRNQTGTYKESFIKLEEEFKDNTDKLQSFKSALKSAANLTGYHAIKFENDSKLIEKIVKDLVEKLSDIYQSKSSDLVGIDQDLIVRIVSFLKEKANEVQIAAIWGMGGIGKTEIARVVFDIFALECSCFLEDVRERSQYSRQGDLRKQLLSELPQAKSKSASSKSELRREKFLIVLDDVSTVQQIEYLVGLVHLGPNTRVIITGRNRHVLIVGGAHRGVHVVQGLNDQHSLELFCLKAFNKNHPEDGYDGLSQRVVHYAKGIPLALKVLGFLLHSKDLETWRSELRKLEQNYPNKEIQEVLKVSYDELDDVKKDIFLDIAFFYEGCYKDDIIQLLSEPDFATCEIDNLQDIALLTISKDNHIEMHPLIQQMGWQIVRGDSNRDLGRCSRLRDKEAFEVLKENKGTEAIKGIILNVSQIENDVHLSVDTFKKMTNLMFLKFHSSDEHKCLHIPAGLESFSDCLRYFHWDKYPSKSLPLRAKNLVELHLRFSLVEKLWDGVQDLVTLRKVDLSGSKKLKELPDFSTATKLEWVDLSNCISLESLPKFPRSFKRLNVNNCTSLKSVFIVTLLHDCSMKFLSLINCVGPCKPRIMEHAYLLLQPPRLEGNASGSVCYPGGRVPKWFQNNRRQEASITIELSPSTGDLKGFVCGFVLRSFHPEQMSRIHLNYQCSFEDGTKVQGMIGNNIDMATALSSDHVFLLHDGLCSDQILRGLLDRRRDDQVHTQKLSFEFSVVVNGETATHDDLLKECGVCPMSIAEYENFLVQFKLERQKMERSCCIGRLRDCMEATTY